MMAVRKICVVTGTRADYGLLSGLMAALQQCKEFELQLIATAMHLSPEFGLTYRQIENDGFVINEKIEMLLSGDTAVSITKSMGLGTIGFADAYDRLRPDLVVILGDRFEALAAAQAAMIAKIPVAHIHGGEVTEGAVDESIRHSITKMSHLHFVATDEFKKRVIQLGEQPDNVHVCGAPGIDNIKNMELLDRSALEQSLDFDLGQTCFLVTYHPVTLATVGDSNSMTNLLDALDAFPEAKIIITFPNADADGRQLISQVKEYAARQPDRIFVTDSLGQLRYLSALQHVDAVIGNSSSGLLEVPSFKKPTINIGDRQKGRLKAGSVIDCAESTLEIVEAIRFGLSEEFRKTIQTIENPYGDGNAIERILTVLKKCNLKGLVRKPFYNIDF